LIEDHLRAGWKPEALQTLLHLTEQEMIQVLDYLDRNRENFDREYEKVAAQAAAREKYWRQRERKRRKTSKTQEAIPPEHSAAWAHLNEIKRQEKHA
jgi:DNA gyrase/topoisomerase IV subunit B